jgi:hypothetical protein
MRISLGGRPKQWLEVGKVREEPKSSLTRVASVAEIDSLPTDTAAVLVAELDDGKIAALRRLNAPRFLYQDGYSRVTDTGLSYLVTFPELERLDLQGSSEITDQGLLELRLLRGLRRLDLRGCRRLTETGIAALRAALPRCEIVA